MITNYTIRTIRVLLCCLSKKKEGVDLNNDPTVFPSVKTVPRPLAGAKKLISQKSDTQVTWNPKTRNVSGVCGVLYLNNEPTVFHSVKTARGLLAGAKKLMFKKSDTKLTWNPQTRKASPVFGVWWSAVSQQWSGHFSLWKNYMGGICRCSEAYVQKI